MADKEEVNALAKELYGVWAKRTKAEARWPALSPEDRSAWRHVATKAFEVIGPDGADEDDGAE